MSWIFFPVSAVKSMLSDMPLKSALLAQTLNSLPQWSGSVAPNLGRQSSLVAQLALPEPRNQQSRHRQAHPRKIPTTQNRPLFPRRAGTRASPFVHSPAPYWHRARHTVNDPFTCDLTAVLWLTKASVGKRICQSWPADLGHWESAGLCAASLAAMAEEGQA